MIYIKNIWRVIRPPIFLLSALLLFWYLWGSVGLPENDDLIDTIRGYFENYGIWIVLASAVVEGTLLLGMYYPGSLVIFLGVIFARESILDVVLVVLLVNTGLIIAYTIDYVLGKYGWYRLLVKFGLGDSVERAKIKLTAYGSKAILGSYWHPNLAALISTAAGILHYPLKRFYIYSVVSVISWNVVWATLAYFLGESVIHIIGIRFALIVSVVWLVYRVWNYKKFFVMEGSVLR